jgi:hypothetical protein
MLDRMPEVGDQVQLECTDREHKDEDDLPIKARLSRTEAVHQRSPPSLSAVSRQASWFSAMPSSSTVS